MTEQQAKQIIETLQYASLSADWFYLVSCILLLGIIFSLWTRR